jgi:PTH1 family peptidyl-tRNA hydrolase
LIRLISALGNPGHEYEKTRHNVSWMLLEHLHFYSELSWKNKFSGEYASFHINHDILYFLKPFTYMNLSGNSIRKAMDFFKIEAEEILIIHDELELEFGTISFKDGGGLGGHNGLRSITDILGTRNFKRVRLGISKPVHQDITSYVLGKFSENQQVFLNQFLKSSADLIDLCIRSRDFSVYTKKFNKYKIID